MPVVEKIESSSADGLTLPRVTIDTKYIRIWHQEPPIELITADNKIEAIWIAVVEFIKWYNQNNPSN